MFIENVLAKFQKDVIGETEIPEMMHEDTKIKLVIEVTLTVGVRVDLILQAPQKMITPPKF